MAEIPSSIVLHAEGKKGSYDIEIEGNPELSEWKFDVDLPEDDYYWTGDFVGEVKNGFGCPAIFSREGVNTTLYVDFYNLSECKYMEIAFYNADKTRLNIVALLAGTEWECEVEDYLKIPGLEDFVCYAQIITDISIGSTWTPSNKIFSEIPSELHNICRYYVVTNYSNILCVPSLVDWNVLSLGNINFSDTVAELVDLRGLYGVFDNSPNGYYNETLSSSGSGTIATTTFKESFMDANITKIKFPRMGSDNWVFQLNTTFKGIQGLTEIVIPIRGILGVSKECFCNSSLEKIYLPYLQMTGDGFTVSGCKEYGALEGIFDNCTNLQKIYVQENEFQLNENTDFNYAVCFTNTPCLSGDTGFTYDENKVTLKYACIGNEGYFSLYREGMEEE